MLFYLFNCLSFSWYAFDNLVYLTLSAVHIIIVSLSLLLFCYLAVRDDGQEGITIHPQTTVIHGSSLYMKLQET